MTHHQRQVIDYLAEQRWVFARDIMRATRLGSGTVYPVLATLCGAGFIMAEREAASIPRMQYRLTERGRSLVR